MTPEQLERAEDGLGVLAAVLLISGGYALWGLGGFLIVSGVVALFLSLVAYGARKGKEDDS